MNNVTLNDLVKCWRRFHADIIKLYISALGHPMKLKFSSYVHPGSYIGSYNASIDLR